MKLQTTIGDKTITFNITGPSEDYVGRRFKLRAATPGEAISLLECPPGLFLYQGDIGFKSEYGANSADHMEVYCVDSGEIFWGGTKMKVDRAKLMVSPVELVTQ